MEFVVGGDLLFHILKVGKFDEERVVFYTAELVLALEFLHYKGILHRDLKLENVMLTDKGHVKLTDFGVCTKVSPGGWQGAPGDAPPRGHHQHLLRHSPVHCSRDDQVRALRL